MEINIKRHELDMLLFMSLRYAIGRKSYAVQVYCELIEKYFKHLDNADQLKVISEIEKELSSAESRNETVGMRMDHDEWKKCLAKLQEIHAST